jgi:tRNA1(Val) A37 N6-methylase TrmN6
LRTELAILARQALTSSDLTALGEALATQELPDSFGVLGDSELVKLLSNDLEGDDPAKWVTRPLTWNISLYDPHVVLNSSDKLLHLLWQDLNTRLSRKLEAVGRRTTLSSRGAVLCFFGRARFSIVVEYTRSGGGAVNLRPLAALTNPNGVLELGNLLDVATAESQNAIKNAALSVDKLVFQRGSIIHVDRQREDVFGPTIDTVILGELLAESLENRKPPERISALEIGSGSGLLSAILGSSNNVSELTAIDLNTSAVTCTLKNLQINDVTLDSMHQRVRVRAERFAPDQLIAPFDLVVCNPPYIPSPPDSSSSSTREYGRAVGGLELCEDILKSLPNLLAPNGALLLMASSLSDTEVKAMVPQGFEATAALSEEGRRVPLDVDTVWDDPKWRERLIADQRIEEDDRGRLWHALRPLWVRRSGG